MVSTAESSIDPIFHFSDLIDDQHQTSLSPHDASTAPSEEIQTLFVHLPIASPISVIENVNSTGMMQPETHLAMTMTPYSNLTLEEDILKRETRSGMDLSFQKLIDQDMPILVEHAIINKQCAGLELWANEITSQGVSILANALHNNTTLKELRLSENHVSDEGVRHLAQILSLNTSNLKVLDLDANTVTDEGVHYLSEMLKINSTLVCLKLSENKIGNRGVQLLADALAGHNTNLQELYLSNNHLVSDSSVDSLVTMFKQNQSLKKLDILGCNFLQTGVIKLRMATKDRTNFNLLTDKYFAPNIDMSSLWTSLKTFFP